MKVFYLILLISIFTLSCENNNPKSNISQETDSQTFVKTPTSSSGGLSRISPKDTNSTSTPLSNPSLKTSKKKVQASKIYEKYTGDLEEMKRRGKIRIIAFRSFEEKAIPTRQSLVSKEINFIKLFAKENNLIVKFIYKNKFEELIPALKRGEGDIIAANLTVTDERKQEIEFTDALTSINELIIGRKNQKIKNFKDLEAKSFYVKKSTSYYNSLKKYKDSVKINIAPENLTEDLILDKISDKKYDFTIIDDNKFEEISLYRDDLKAYLTINKHLAISWGIRKDSLNFKKELNKFISIKHIDLRVDRIHSEDFDEIKKRGYIRVLTRNNSMNYFLYKGNIFGFEYELVKFFAKQHKLRVEFIIPPSRDKLQTWLLEGKGDMIAASITKDTLTSKELLYSDKYDLITEMLVSSSDSTIKTVNDLSGKTFYIRKSSSYNKTLEKYKEKYKYNIKYVSETEETEEIIEKVANKEYELTLADSSILNREISMGTKAKKLFAFDNTEKEYSWVVRKNNPLLLKEVNSFIKKNYKGLTFNIIYNKYFKNIKRIIKLGKLRTNKTGQISNYDELFKKYSKKYHFNWLMIASQSYMESRFNPQAESWVGALGLMQVMPKTGKMLGFTDLVTPNYGVHAGVKYMNWLEKRFSPDIPAKDKMWFALASYNAGYGHILDAQRIAKVMGLNPNKWFNNVEVAMTKLSKKEYRKHTKYGYCKCTEPIAYVSNIKTRYEAYQDVMNKK